MDDPRLLCARLLRQGGLRRDEARGLDFPDIRREVESRLAEVGLTLATSVYSEHVAIRLSPEVVADQAFDSASNLGLKADACALLVVLWARLVLQKRTAMENREAPGQASLLAEDQRDGARAFTPHVRFETLYREFGPYLGGKTRLHSLVTQLRRLHFVGGRGDVIEAGPLLELAIDGEKMVAFIKRRVFAEVLEREALRDDAAPDEAAPEAAEQVVNVLRQLGGSAVMRELEQQTRERSQRLRQLIAELEDRGAVYRTGTRGSTRYHLKSS